MLAHTRSHTVYFLELFLGATVFLVQIGMKKVISMNWENASLNSGLLINVAFAVGLQGPTKNLDNYESFFWCSVSPIQSAEGE